MSKKDDTATMEDLRTQLKLEQDRSAILQRDNEDRQRRADDQARRDSDEVSRLRNASVNAEPSEEQWVKLEEEYAMTRDVIRNTWKLTQRANAPLVAELQTYRSKDAAADAVRSAKSAAALADPQFSKYEPHVDEYLADISAAEKSDPKSMAKHMDRAINYALGKARKTGTFRDSSTDPIKDGRTQEQKDENTQGFGSHEISGIPLTINVEKRVPDDYRKVHAHPEKEGAVRMNERATWNAGIPTKPR